jgi:type II secretory pathway component PulF
MAAAADRRRRLRHIRLHAQALARAADRRRPPSAAPAGLGDIVRKATIARWARTLSTMFAAGVPLVEALDSVGGAAGNHIYKMATKQIQSKSAPAPA